MALQILLQFVFRLSFGLALSMAVTPSKLVTSGYFRVHLWVLLGLATLAALAAFTLPSQSGNGLPIEIARGWTLTVALAAAVASYFGAIVWLYEASRLGKVLLCVVSALCLAGAIFATPWAKYPGPEWPLALLDLTSGGLLLGSTMAAMLLGHWYLNTPTMKLMPLQRLVLLMGAAVLFRAVVAGVGFSLEFSQHTLSTTTLWFIALRWLSGIVGVLLLTVMTWQTLKIPNTQSATGILYVGVICTFLGELASQLLSAETNFPL